MIWQWFSPSKIVFGSGAIKENENLLKTMGSRALIVTGKGGSAKRNGSLSDICDSLENLKIDWDIFNEVEANPSVDTARKAADMARMMGPDFIIGIGGGSPMDAAKAVAILAVNDLSDEELFALEFSTALPVLAVPTTAGTGSEVTPYSILTYPAIENKKSIFSSLIVPQLAFIDPLYTVDLPLDITIDTAVDAYSHALEGFLSPRANPLSDLISREVLKILGNELRKLSKKQNPDLESREALLYASTLAGLVISQTGTSIPHAMGYSLSYFKNLPHGRANAVIMPAYMEFNFSHTDNPRLREVLDCSGFNEIEEFTAIMRALSGPPPVCSEDEQRKFLRICSVAKNISNNIVIPSESDLKTILKKSIEI